jgi:outer membrane protein assembly factor BamA
VVLTNHSVLRGYPDGAFRGRSFASGNAELRFPLGSPQRGWRTLPVFVRHVHAGLFVDAGNAWSGSFRVQDVLVGVGGSLGADVVIGHGLPLTGVLSVGQGLGDSGETRVDLRLGLAF